MAPSSQPPEWPAVVRAVAERCGRELSSEECYQSLASQGLQYGPEFRGLTRIAVGQREAVAEIQLRSARSGPYVLAPQLLDSALQTLAVLASAEPANPMAPARLPALIRSVRVLGRPSGRVVCHASLEEGGGEGSRVGRVWLYDVEGTPVVEVEGLVLRPPGEALSARGWARERVYAVRWEERAAPPTPAGARATGAP